MTDERNVNCQQRMRDEGLATPRTCPVCGLGPCKWERPTKAKAMVPPEPDADDALATVEKMLLKIRMTPMTEVNTNQTAMKEAGGIALASIALVYDERRRLRAALAIAEAQCREANATIERERERIAIYVRERVADLPHLTRLSKLAEATIPPGDSLLAWAADVIEARRESKAAFGSEAPPSYARLCAIAEKYGHHDRTADARLTWACDEIERLCYGEGDRKTLIDRDVLRCAQIRTLEKEVAEARAARSIYLGVEEIKEIMRDVLRDHDIERLKNAIEKLTS